MIVENSEKPWISIKKLLALINYEIGFETSNGYEAIEKYSALKHDLLLLDVTLSKFDGLGVLKEIKKFIQILKSSLLHYFLTIPFLKNSKNLGHSLSLPFLIK